MEQQYQKLESTVALMGNDISYMKADINEIKTNQVRNNDEIKSAIKDLVNGFVSRPEHVEVTTIQKDHEARLRVSEEAIQDYPLVKKVVFGGVSFILISVLSSIVYLVIQK